MASAVCSMCSPVCIGTTQKSEFRRRNHMRLLAAMWADRSDWIAIRSRISSGNFIMINFEIYISFSLTPDQWRLLSFSPRNCMMIMREKESTELAPYVCVCVIECHTFIVSNFNLQSLAPCILCGRTFIAYRSVIGRDAAAAAAASYTTNRY